MKKIRAVLFDMDGLMFDTQRLWDKAWKQAGEACGVPMGEEQIAPLRGRSLADSRAAFEKAARLLTRCVNRKSPWNVGSTGFLWWRRGDSNP